MLPRVAQEIERAKQDYADLQVRELADGSIHVEVPNVVLPSGWSQSTTKILIVLPAGYPQAAPSGFFAEPNILGPGGKNPDGSGQNQINGVPWKSFCWRPNTWDNSRENLWRYIKFVQTRFLENR